MGVAVIYLCIRGVVFSRRVWRVVFIIRYLNCCEQYIHTYIYIYIVLSQLFSKPFHRLHVHTTTHTNHNTSLTQHTIRNTHRALVSEAVPDAVAGQDEEAVSR